MKRSKVPTTRLGRLVRLGFTAGELAVGGAVEGIRRIGSIRPDDLPNVFLTTANAEKLAKRLAGMRGAAMKMGQMLSMEGADILPKEFTGALAMLRDSGDTMPLTQIRRVMGREYGKGWEDRFIDFDYMPIAAASIGQVHRATTMDGRDLALKIQYPGVSKSINSDVDNMAMFLRLAKLLPVEFDIGGIIKEAKRQLHQEADYQQEAAYLKAYGAFVKDEAHFLVPKVHDDFTTKRVLAMDYIEGVPLESLGEEGVPQELRDQVGSFLEELVFRELFEFRTMQSDPNFANYFYQPEENRIVLLDFGSTVTFEKSFTDKYARITQALIEEDDGAARHYAERIGYLDPGASDGHAARILELIRMICEPIRHDRVYDFGSSDLFARARDFGIEMAFSDISEAKVPPPETMFLHRKLMGSYMLCHRIGSRVNVQELIRPFVG